LAETRRKKKLKKVAAWVREQREREGQTSGRKQKKEEKKESKSE
jgi:hypothetical protein